jgi:hypothetical protein
MNAGAWIAWALAFAVAVAALVIAVLAWRKPLPTPPLRQPPPDLLLEAVGGLASSSGGSTEHVKAKLRLVNGGQGVARHWQVAVYVPAGSGAKLARAPHRGPLLFSDPVTWNQDAGTGEIPFDQGRDLPDWLWVEAASGTQDVRLPVELMAEGMAMKMGLIEVTFPSGGIAAVRCDIRYRT